MAPSTKTTKPTKTGGKDIRTFFGNSQSSPSQSRASQSKDILRAPKSNEMIDISDDDDEGMAAKPKVASSSMKAKATQNETPKIKSKDSRSTAVDVEQSDSPQPTRRRKKPAALISSDDEELEVEKAPPPKKKAALASATSSKPKARPSVTTNGKPTPKKTRKDKDYEETESEEPSDGSEEEVEVVVKKARRAPATKGNTKKDSEKTKSNSAAKTKDTAKAGSSKSFDWAAVKAAKLAGPVAPGSKNVPNGEPNCLAGLSFVFTGELSAFSRDEALDLAKRYGGRVVLQPSSKTDYVVLGVGAGPAKLAAINKHNLRTLSEDQFLNLIATRSAPGIDQLDDKTRKKMQKEEQAIKEAAKELEKMEKKVASSTGRSSNAPMASCMLWTSRYAPQSMKEICGNKGQVEKLQQWLQDWPGSLKSGFKKPGKNGMNVFRAVLVTGSPGIGKTTSAHLCAKAAGFTPIELNASDARSKKLVENATNINNTSLDGWMNGNHATNAAGVAITDRSCLIMDEVDGMSAGDRGGVGALNALIKRTKIPIICIANDRNAQKLKPLVHTTFNLTFRKPEAASIRSRILSILFKEKMKIPANVIDELVAGAQSDIRQILNMLSTWRLSNKTMDFDEGKNLAKLNEKYSIMTPFDITHKMLGPYLFSATARETLGDKMELYFHDHSFVPLFIQENYLKTQISRVRNLEGPEKTLKQLELMDRAASSISDGDLVDALIHGPEQHWSLMPLHAVCSAIRPASFIYGQGSGYAGPNAMGFPQWLGQNSKQNKLSRQLGDVQIRMRLKVSGDKSEIRQSYVPALFPHIVKPLMDEGASAVEDVIGRMDEYYLCREDWDTVVELGVDDHKDDIVLKKILSATKSSLTRKYNATDHPIPFHKAQDVGKVPKKLAGGPAPDLEEAFDLEDDINGDPSDDEKSSKDNDDFSKDKLIQTTKTKGKKALAQTKSKGKTKK